MLVFRFLDCDRNLLALLDWIPGSNPISLGVFLGLAANKVPYLTV